MNFPTCVIVSSVEVGSNAMIDLQKINYSQGEATKTKGAQPQQRPKHRLRCPARFCASFCPAREAHMPTPLARTQKRPLRTDLTTRSNQRLLRGPGPARKTVHLRLEDSH